MNLSGFDWAGFRQRHAAASPAAQAYLGQQVGVWQVFDPDGRSPELPPAFAAELGLDTPTPRQQRYGKLAANGWLGDLVLALVADFAEMPPARLSGADLTYMLNALVMADQEKAARDLAREVLTRHLAALGPEDIAFLDPTREFDALPPEAGLEPGSEPIAHHLTHHRRTPVELPAERPPSFRLKTAYIFRQTRPIMGERISRMDRDIDLFLDMMAAERGAANHTLSAYRRDLEGLQKFLEKRASAMRAAGEEDLRAYLGELNKRALAASTVARHLSAIRRFFTFCKPMRSAKIIRLKIWRARKRNAHCRKY